MDNKVKTLLKAAYHYYELNQPIMTNEKYDELFEEVKQINPELCEKVCLGYFEGKSTVKVKHSHPMLSIEKNNTRANIEDKEFIAMPKLDGVACSLVYKKGELIYQLTRGDGVYGSDITKHKIRFVPLKLDEQIDIVIRGEVMCPKYKNYGQSHRNIVAGTLGLVDIYKAADRELEFYAYWTSYYNVLPKYEDELEWLALHHFVVPMYRKGNVTSFNVSYPTDGVVFRINDNKYYGEHTGHHYKNIWCWKPVSPKKETKIIDVEWKQSKNATLTPVALVNPVEIDETIISQVNLMSLDYIQAKDIAINDTVLVHKAKGIIPEIVEVVNRPPDRQSIYLVYCPKCGTTLVKDGIYLKCTNVSCAVDKFIEFFCKVMGIKGLAIKNIEKLQLQHPLDLYFLTQEDLEVLGKIGVDIYKEIQESKKLNIIKVLTALNPPKVKEITLRKIFNKIDTLDDLSDFDKLVKIDGVGPIIAEAFIDWFIGFQGEYLPVVKQIGFDMTIKKTSLNKEIGLTGTIPEKRADFVARMDSDYGIQVKNSVTKNTKCLIVGDKASQKKISKAESLGIPIVDYYAFIKDFTKDD